MSEFVAATTRGTFSETNTPYVHVLRPAAAALLVSVAYYVGAQIGFALTFQPYPVSTLWPPNAILFAALLLSPKRWWWFLLLATFPAHLLVESNANVPFSMILSWFVSNCSEAMIGASLLRYLLKHSIRFETPQHVGFFFLVVFLSVFLSSFLDTTLVRINQYGDSPYWSLFRMRFFSNVLASLTLVPFILSWTNFDFRSLRKTSVRVYVELAALVSGLIIVGFFSFFTQRPGVNTTAALLYLPLPLLLWAAIRFGPKGTSLALLAVSFFAIWGAIHERGPFATQSAEMNALSVQLFLILSSLPLLVLAALIKERERAQDVARQRGARLAAILRALPDMVFVITREGIYLDYHAREPDELLVPPSVFLGKSIGDVMPPDLAERMMHSLAKTTATDEPQVLEYSLPVKGEERHYEARLIGMQGDKTLSIVRDVTDRQRASQALRNSQKNLNRSHNQIRGLLRRLIDIQESERRRISRELHDDLGQKIASLSISLSRIKKNVPMPEAQLISELDEVREDTSRLTNEVRNLSHQLHPAVLEHLGLVAALETHIDNFKNEEQMDVSFRAELAERKVPFETSICIYRVVTEALRNVSRHSAATSVSVLLKEDDNVIELQVSDNGRGFDVESALKGNGLGLINIEERVRFLQGSCQFHSAPHQGTRIVAKVPLTEHA